MRKSALPFQYRRRGIITLAAVLLFSGAHCRADESPVTAEKSSAKKTPVTVEPASSDETPATKFSYVYTRWQEANDFKRISEYFSGKENKGGDIIVRTDNATRQGLYFRIGMPLGTQFAEHAKVTLEYIRNDDSQIRTQEFDLPAMPDGPFAEIRLGLTGKEWASKRTTLVAWRLTLRDNKNKLLAQTQSYLWSMPKKESSPSPDEKGTCRPNG